MANILDKVLRAGEGKRMKVLAQQVAQINELAPAIARLSNTELAAKTAEFRQRVDNGEPLADLLYEAFAVAREAAERTVDMRPFDVQCMGGIVLFDGDIAEMRTGEGKTLVATMPVYLRALAGRGTHLVTVNDYLAKRDAEWMSPIYRFLGLEVGIIQAMMEPADRRVQYAADITYGTNSEFGFDYLRDNMAMRREHCVQRGHYYCIVDEVDSILVDEARTPLIISGAPEVAADTYRQFARVVPRLKAGEDYEVDEKHRTAAVTESGVAKVEKALSIDNLYAASNGSLVNHLIQALRAEALYHKDVEYVVQNGEVLIVDEFTGRILEGRRYSEGLHQAIEAKERVPIKEENQTLATITLQNYFRLYEVLAGMTGTAKTEEDEFQQIYGLSVVQIPTNVPMIRDDRDDYVFKTTKEKHNAVVEDIVERYQKGQPVLVGTVSVEVSELLHELLERKGVPHNVLNAKYHEKEAEIIKDAGKHGAVTIATNMAGRGVDIKLGGELNEEVLADVIRVLEKAGVAEPYDLSNDARRVELEKLSEEDYGIYSESIHTFINYLEDMKRVRALGGLHVIGSERHEARRIDNQLRGRAARQGDPGSSRFYLSLEDELMRLFGGGQMEALMTRMKVDPSLPIESRLLGRMVEQAQERVEGNNFDVRKHLLEYDDVLNSQRKRIYAERDRAFQKEDLHDDVVEILRTELNVRIPKALADEEGPWKLLGYLEEVQPSMNFETEGIRAPSYTLRLMVEQLRATLPENPEDHEIRNSLLEIAELSLRAENEHILKSTRILLDKTEETVDEINRERLDTIDTFFEGLEDARDDEELAQRRPQELLEELSNLTRTQLRLSSEELRALPEADRVVKEKIRGQVTRALSMLAITRTIGSVERRLDESLNLKPTDLQDLDWEDIADGILTQVNATLEKRTESLLSPQGQLTGNIDAVLARAQSSGADENRLVDLLMNMSRGTRMAIDSRTHQRGMKHVILVNYIFHAARLIQDRPVNEITRDVLEHLEMIQQRLETVWGRIEFERFRLSGATMQNLDPQIKNALRTEIGDASFAEIEDAHPDALTAETREKLEVILGRRTQNQIHRHILLSVISELWVDYLTRVDALRVSIGLEAFAQRDPLVQYKGQASEMFRALLSDIRAGVISRMFLFQPRRPGGQAADRPATDSTPTVKTESSEVSVEKKKKRKRH